MDQDPSFSAGEEVPAGAIAGRTGPLGVLAGRGLPGLPDNGAAGGATPEERPTLDDSRPAAARFSVLGRRLVTSARSAVLVPGRSSQLASAVHVASLAGAFAFWAWLDRGLWFFGDEWEFLLTAGLSYGADEPERDLVPP